MTEQKREAFFRLYRIFFYINFLFFIIFLFSAAIMPETFSFFKHTAPVCDREKDFMQSLFEYWAISLIPMCVVFLIGLTIYIPIFSVIYNACSGACVALNIHAFFTTYGTFFAITMSFIEICTAWLHLWYSSYLSGNSVRLYTSNLPFSKNMTFSFIGKYIIWFALFAITVLLSDIAQCIMYRI